MYLNQENSSEVNENSASYDADKCKQNLYSLIGEKATNMLYEKLSSYHNIVCADDNTLLWAGLNDKQVSCINAAKKFSDCYNLEKVMSSMDIYTKYKYLRFYNEEHFIIVCLNRNNKIISDFELSMGGTSGTIVDTKVLFRKALVYPRLSAIILIHNHPSGNSDPSPQDKDITSKVKQCCQLLDITLLDHVIIAGEKYYSFADEGTL